MGSLAHAKQEVKHHAEHMPQRQHGHHAVARPQVDALTTKHHVGPDAPVRQHDSLGVARGAGCIVDDGQLLRRVTTVNHVLGTEVIRVMMSEQLVQASARGGYLLRTRHQQRKVRQVHDGFQSGHKRFVQVFPYLVAHKKHTRLRVIHDVMYVIRFKLMQDGYRHSAISYHAQKGYHPMGTVTAANGYLVAGTYAALLQHDVHLGYLARHIFVA